MDTDNTKWTKYNKPELTVNQRASHNHYLKIRNLRNNENGNFENINKNTENIDGNIKVEKMETNGNKINSKIKKEFNKSDKPDKTDKELKQEYNLKKHGNIHYNQNMLIIGISIVLLAGAIVYILVNKDDIVKALKGD